MRISRYLASSGIASRRQAEKIVLEGLVSVNDQIIRDLSYKVLETDKVKLANSIINVKTPRLWIFNKPRGLVVSHRDELGRENIFDYLKSKLKLDHVISIGRLDLDSEGLILITNSGELARKFEIGRYIRKYHVRAYGQFNMEEVKKELFYGLKINGFQYKTIQIKALDTKKFLNTKKESNRWYEVSLIEGKNREIRNIFEHFGLQVNRLIRISYDKYFLNDMKPWEIKEINAKDLLW